MSEEATTQVSRRTVAKGAAWAAPVILGGTAAPAYAASGGGPTITAGPACKLPGNSCNPFVKGYIFLATVRNTSDKTVWLYPPATVTPIGDVDFTLDYGGAAVGGVVFPPGTTIEIPAHGEVVLTLNTARSDSANLVFSFTISFAWGHTADPADDTEHVGNPVSTIVDVPSTSPCNNCQPPGA